MTDASARFALPFILPGQAQKELYHNEALALLDAALHADVEEEPLATPPASPEPGQGWIVAAAATGAWTGEEDRLAIWTGGGWRFVTPVPGMTVWRRDAGYRLSWSGTAWNDGAIAASAFEIDGQQVVGPRQPDVPSPLGGTTIDAEARAAIEALIATLRTHGLIE